MVPYRQGRTAAEDAFKLSSNENPFPPLPAVLEAIGASAVNRYPEGSAARLRELLGELQVQRGCVIGGHAAFCTGTLANRQYRNCPVRTVQMGWFTVLYWARSLVPVAGGPRQLAAQ